jgi:glycosyltransferase involved in cell wall biosynthesis
LPAYHAPAVPDVSVLLPFRDAEGTLEEALDSVLGQRAVDLELIAVDDGSRDASSAIAARLAARHTALRIVRTEGLGIARALQLATQHAHSELIARMDGDDIALEDRLARQLDVLAAEPELAVLGTQVTCFPEAEIGEGLARYVAWQNELTSAEEHARQLFIESPLCHPSIVLRRAALDAVGGYRDGDFPEDYDLFLRLDAAGYALAKLPEVLLRWRHHQTRATVTDTRYDRARFLATKAPHLARRLLELGRPIDVWGAGTTGKRIVRALEPYGVRVQRFIDIDPDKIGRTARGAPIISSKDVGPPSDRTVVVAVAARGARDLVRDQLDALGYREGSDYLCAS